MKLVSILFLMLFSACGYSQISFRKHHSFDSTLKAIPGKETDTILSMRLDRETDTVPRIMVVIDTALTALYNTFPSYVYNAYWIKGYAVREKHNTGEGVIDPGFYQCIDKSGRLVPCFNDYWEDIMFLDDKKRPLNKNLVIIKTITL